MNYLIIISLILSIISLILILFLNNDKYKIVNIILSFILIIIQLVTLFKIKKLDKCIKGKNETNLAIEKLNKENIYYKIIYNKQNNLDNININQLFNDTFEYGKLVRPLVKNGKLNGLEAWNKIKPYIINFNCNNSKLIWTKTEDEINKLYNYVYNDLGMKGDDNDEKNNNWEKYHFFLQLYRIPKNNYNKNDIILRVAQIGYNMGQMQSEIYDNKALEWLNNELKIYKNNVNYFVNNCNLIYNS